MKVLKFLGAFLYGALMSYLVWLLFYWLTPIVMSISWSWFIVYLLAAGGFMSCFIGSITYFLSLPWIMLCANSKLVRYVPVPFLLFFGYSSIKLPWSFGSDWGVLQWIVGISFTVIILITFLSLLYIAFFKVDEN